MRKLTVSQLNNYIYGVFDDEQVLHDIAVSGEVSEVKRYGRSVYFTLKEGECSLSCVSFHNLTELEEGKTVDAFGSVSFYRKSGKISYIVNAITLSGEGLQLLKLKQLKEKLEAEGVFSNRPPLPAVINKIAVITSGSGAVIHDIISVAVRKNPLINIMLFDAKVQGAYSAQSVIHALKVINEKKFGCDVIIIARGGGSNDDLSSFNDEQLAREVSASTIPVVSAVGHEVDYTLCDLASSLRAGTPSIAADLTVRSLEDDLSRLGDCASALKSLIDDIYRRNKEKIVYLSQKMVSSCQLMAESYKSVITGDINKIYNSLISSQTEKEQELKMLASKLDALSPLKVLSQGYSKITLDGKDISKAEELKTGDIVNINFSDGKKEAEVK